MKMYWKQSFDKFLFETQGTLSTYLSRNSYLMVEK